ncbi:hypothetical protein AV954_gp60 [Escherichia phage SSL-2009a]|uniref:Uncharacterized protein n=1 Tax=Escherichia phage SSL-2009a TaxID=2681619 RepID=T2DPW9_9CAUD|nr:hypothetical protein AV954_gp60 [Escherichia phage SSL-2009a]AGV55612.1 hypothetical protein [Escherichia phage SSL-2009a]
MGAPYWQTGRGNSMLHDVIYWFGLIGGLCLLTAVLLGVLLFVAWPAVEAASITRMTFEIYKRRGITEHPTRLRMWWLWYRDMIGGRTFEAVRSSGWEWKGVGKWSVFD